MPSLIGKKIGMTSIYDANRRAIACTLIEAGPNVVTQLKTIEVDGYQAVQLGFSDKKEKNTPNSMKGHFKKAGTTPKRKVAESEYFVPTYYKKVEEAGAEGAAATVRYEAEVGQELKLGDEIGVDLFVPGEWVAVVGTTKGKGFQGPVKRHGFGGVGGRTHGQHNRGRAPGSLGPGSTPSRVFKGKRLGGQMGGDRVKMTNLQILKVIPEKNLLVVSGSVPGHNGSYLIIEK